MSSTFSDAKTQGEVSSGTYKDTVSKITILVPPNTSQINGIKSQLKVIPKIKPHKLTTLKGYLYWSYFLFHLTLVMMEQK